MTTYKGQLALKDIAEFAGASRPTVSNWRARNEDFPQPTAASTPRRPFFDFGEVIEWLKKQDLLPDEWKEKAAHMAVTSAVNPLTAFRFNQAEAVLFSLAILAANKSNGFELSRKLDGEEVLEVLAQEFAQLAQAGTYRTDPAKVIKAARSLPADATRTLVSGLLDVDPESYPQAADIIVETFLGNAGRSAFGYLSTNDSVVSQLITSAARTTLGTDDLIYDPTCGIGSTLLSLQDAAPRGTLVGNDIETGAITIATLRAYLSGVDAEFSNADVFTEDLAANIKANTIVCEPPLGERIDRQAREKLEAHFGEKIWKNLPPGGNSEHGILALCLERLAEHGRAYILIRTALLSQDFASNFFHKLVAEGAIEAIIQLPRKLLTYTSLGTSLIVLRAPSAQDSTKPVLLADASSSEAPEKHISQWLKAMRAGEETDIPTGTITLSELVAGDGSLLPAQRLNVQDTAQLEIDYAESRSQLSESLAALQEKITNAIVPPAELPVSRSTKTLHELIKNGDIEKIRSAAKGADEDIAPDDVEAHVAGIPFRRKIEPVYVAPDAETLRPGDILVPLEQHLKASVFNEEGMWVPSFRTHAFRIKNDKFCAGYLVDCINAEYNEVNDGRNFSRRKLANIVIPVLSREAQEALLNSFHQINALNQAATALSEQIDSLKDNAFSAIRYLNQQQ